MNQMQERFKPVSVADVTEYDPMKGAVRAKRVNYVLQDGTRSYITVPLEHYNAQEVAQRLEDAANAHDDVMSIRGPANAYNPNTQPNPFGT